MENKKFYMYSRDSKDYEKWWTTDSELIKGFKKSKRYEYSGNFSAATCFISFISILASGGAHLWIFLQASIIIFIVTLILAIITYSINYKIFTQYLNQYFTTTEYKELSEKYEREILEEKDKYLTEQSTKLVESYDILSDSNLSKEERIELLKKYIE